MMMKIEKSAIKQILIERKEKPTQEKINRFIEVDNKYWKDRASGKIKDPYKFKTKEEKTKWVRAQRFIKYFKNISFEKAVEINENYIKYLSKNIVPIENATEILDYLYKKKYEIYIVTNGSAKPVQNKLNGIKAEKYIKNIFTAEEAGYMKPHKEFFEKFFEKIKSNKKEEMIIIGDELEKDVLGGIQNGISSCWVNKENIKNKTEIKPTYEIKKLEELRKIL